MKYSDWLKLWLNNYIKPSVKERTFIRYEQLIRTHIGVKLGEREINDLTPIILQGFVTELLNSGNLKTGKGLSASFVNLVISVIQNSLKTAHLVAVAQKYIKSAFFCLVRMRGLAPLGIKLNTHKN